MNLRILLFVGMSLFGLGLQAEESLVPLQKAPIDPSDLASLQRGARTFFNYCVGCHSLKYVRYQSLAQGIGIVDSQGNVLEKAVKESFVFNTDKITDPILASMRRQDAVNWFGVAPPDLSLVARSRGVDWLYSYLLAFYPDSKRPWGVNNRVFPDVAMPHVLYNLEKSLSPKDYDALVADLVNFLSYVGEPHQQTRKQVGLWVLMFLGVLCVFAILLKREYWKDIK